MATRIAVPVRLCERARWRFFSGEAEPAGAEDLELVEGGRGRRGSTARVNDGETGDERQVDVGKLRRLLDPRPLLAWPFLVGLGRFELPAS